jgi:plastocyanin
MGPTTGATPSMMIRGYSFQPQLDTVAVGTTVTWTNSDGVTHTVTDDAASPAFDVSVSAGGSASFLFQTVGAIHYHCKIHPTMVGTITVNP